MKQKIKYMKVISALSMTLVLSGCGVGMGTGSKSGITHNGSNYGTVKSPYTGKIWLDRNLGAERACATPNDPKCYGDLYQWGRNTDGHEKRNSETTTVKEISIKNTSSKFVLGGDWMEDGEDNGGAYRDANWQRTDGGSVCPKGFRIPTVDEAEAELDILDVSRINRNNTLDKNFLKLPTGGWRLNGWMAYGKEGEITLKYYDDNPFGAIWVYNVSQPTDYYGFTKDDSYVGGSEFPFDRSVGLSVRCIKDDSESN